MPELHAGELGDGAIVIPRVGNSLFQDQSDDDLLDFMARTRKCKPMPSVPGTLKPFRLDDDVEDREELNTHTKRRCDSSRSTTKRAGSTRSCLLRSLFNLGS